MSNKEQERGFSHRSLTPEEYEKQDGWLVGAVHRATSSGSPPQVPSDQMRPEIDAVEKTLEQQAMEALEKTRSTSLRPGSLDRAIVIAVEAHSGQFDKAGAPYILHPLRVMLKQSSDEARIAAVLHDVVEDGEHWTLDRLRAEGFSEAIIDAIDHLTKRETETNDYGAFIERVATNPLALQVKLADLDDNLDITRLTTISEADTQRLNKYQQARRKLLGIGRARDL